MIHELFTPRSLIYPQMRSTRLGFPTKTPDPHYVHITTLSPTNVETHINTHTHNSPTPHHLTPVLYGFEDPNHRLVVGPSVSTFQSPLPY